MVGGCGKEKEEGNEALTRGILCTCVGLVWQCDALFP